MNLPDELDPRVIRLEKLIKGIGLAAVAVAASSAVIAVGASVVAASAIALVALAAVNFAVPVGARYLALKKQKGRTRLAEVFSEETIREDERQEAERIKDLEQSYKTSRSEIEGAQEELRSQMSCASDEEHTMLESQIRALQDVIENAEEMLRQRKVDFCELQRVNKLYIAFHRSAAAMERTQGAERNPAEFQRIETARAGIKQRLRQALAGKTIEQMNAQMRPKSDLQRVAQMGNSRPLVSPVRIKEEPNVPRHR